MHFLEAIGRVECRFGAELEDCAARGAEQVGDGARLSGVFACGRGGRGAVEREPLPREGAVAEALDVEEREWGGEEGYGEVDKEV